MLSAVHTDRSGRVYVSAECTAAGFDGVATVPLERWVPLHPGATLAPLAREADGLDRHGRARGLGRDRWALGAVLPPGHLRTLYPAYRPTDDPLSGEPCAAIGADENGALAVAAIITDPTALQSTATEPVAVLSLKVAEALREHSGNRLIRQLARCARESGCADARAIFLGAGTGALPFAAVAARQAASLTPATTDLVLRRGIERAAPAEPAAFRPTAAEIAEVAIRHLELGGTMVSFGRACDGEPLAAVRLVEDAIALIRESTKRGTIHLETDGTRPQALRRALDAGLDAVTVRLEAGRASVRRESLLLAAGAGASLALAIPVRPGWTDTPAALDALESLLAALPGGLLIFRDAPGDPRAIARPATLGAPLGVAVALERLAVDAPQFRTAAFARPLVAA
ncbi:MAG: radical SAM protein [Chloroflexi bacterium]|nr:radical SAM protein [Chloroflexota bacterium]